nr:hypothetical protein [Tanacetum cinerariifolium]
FKSLAKETDASLAKHKILELETKRLLKAVVSQDIISVVQNASVVDTSDIQTKLECTKERFENCIIKKETEYAKLWNDWYKKCDECKYDNISYDKAYKDMQQKIEWLQAQLGDLKVVSQDIISVVQYASVVVDTSDLQTELERTKERFENCIIKKETEYAKLWNDWYKKCDECKYDKISYDKAYKDMQQKIERLQAQENAHLKATYKNMFDSISVSHAQNKTKIDSLQNELHSTIYKNAKLRTQLFKKVSEHKDNTPDTSKNTMFAKQPIVEILSKIGEINALSKPVTSNSVSTPQESKGVNNDKVIAPGMFWISPDKVSRDAKKVPNTVNASSRTKPITVSQPSVITKKDMNSNLNGLSSTGLDNTKTRRPQPKSNTKNDRVPSASKSSRSKNKEVKVEEHHRNLLISKKNKHISSAFNHDVCLNNYVNGKKSCGRKHKANVSTNETQLKNQPEIKKPKNVGTCKSLATPKPRKPRFLLRWSPTSKMFHQDGKLVAPSNSESHVDCSNGDNACTSNAM